MIIKTAALLCIAFALATCSTVGAVLQEPRVSLHSVSVSKIDFNGAELICRIQIVNPNAVSIPLPEVGWELHLNDNSFLSGVFTENQSIKARGTSYLDVPVSFSHIDLFRTFQSLMGNKQTSYKVSLNPRVTLPVIGSRTWHFEHNGEIPLLQLPSFKNPEMKVGNMDRSGVEIVVTLNLENPNAFEFPPVKISYDYHVNRTSFLRGSTETSGPAPAGSVTPVSFRFPVNYADFFGTFLSLSTSTEVATILHVAFDVGTNAFGNSTINIEIPGTLPLLRF